MSGAGREMVWPVTFMAKIRQFPWKWYWQNSRMFRFIAYTSVVWGPTFILAHRALNSEGNKRMWKEKRAARLVDHFDPKTCPVGKGH